MSPQVSLAFCIFIIFCSIGTNESAKLRHRRSINGEPASPGEFPYTAILTDEDGFLHCGGVLISDKTVLTTAACLESYESETEMRVRLGTNRWAGDIEDDPDIVDVDVASAIPHEDFDSSSLLHDIAIVNLADSVTLSNKVGIACLSNSTDHVGKDVTFSGWGYLEGGGRNEVLHKVQLGVIPLKECEEKLEVFTFDSSVLCSYAPTKDICAGDQGGPLVIRGPPDTVIGVASWTTCTAGVPAVFTNVGSHLEWIKKKMDGAFSC